MTAAALPWLALGGIPRRAPGSVGLPLGLCLPVLALAAALDYQAGASPGTLAFEVGASTGLLLALGLASGGALPRGQVAWLLLVVALPLFSATLAWNDAPGGGIPWLEAAARLSPLEWAFDRADGGALSTWQDVLAPAALVLVLVGFARRES